MGIAIFAESEEDVRQRIREILDGASLDKPSIDNVKESEREKNQAISKSIVWPDVIPAEDFNFRKFIEIEQKWALEIFGPGQRTSGVLEHIREELEEIEEKPDDLIEWIDVILLALNGATRQGYSSSEIVEALQTKFIRNQNRTWPDWRSADPDKAIKHVKTDSD